MIEITTSRDEALIETAVDWMNKGHGVAIATVVSTWGSSPRPVGSQMVVNDIEAFQGSVSGGCIEAAVLTEAQFVIESGAPQRLKIGIDDRQAWDTGLACGGEIEIYIEPMASWRGVVDELSRVTALRGSCCMITNLSTGEKRLLASNLPIGVSKINDDLRSAAEGVIASGNSTLLKLENEEYFLHSLSPMPELIVVGAVHIAQPLVQMATLLGYRCSIIDPRKKFATAERFPGTNLIADHPKNVAKELRVHSRTSVVALSHSPDLDDPILRLALDNDVEYVGALGSRKTHADRIERLRKFGYSEDQLRKIRGPIGLDIGSKTSAEVALAIVAEMTCIKRCGRHGRQHRE